ncbi:hypothetical protein M406DRAFT_107740 [Cryphonectria parasitica EP155]|uniref:SPT2 chromatin protein n=1 Tax=Cryphonectria parasitica (strain ATCC 38755 / EP155) TaxID=660469 RepID=A0A9P4Y8Z4_CRYP1|nr:uncharacterized protein M406DRAFT_107740 [Cryphonectria parasitica EP155]KAF3769164.1 hypothetical protein M406DRAFT_107740 [Cryphonectria parasitica EP155]
MPIGQLLASITGETPKAPAITTRTPPQPTNGTSAKRKADADTKGAAVKAPRTVPTSTPTTGPSKPNGEPSKTSRPAERSTTGYTGSARPTSNTGSRSLAADRPASSVSKKPTLAQNGRPSPTSASFPGSGRSIPSATSSLTKRSGAVTAAGQPATSDPPAKVPKKGSIAEIKARAAAQQQKLQAIGKIQHKATERVPTRKEREEAAAEELRAAKKGVRPGMKPGVVGLPGRNGANGMQRSNGHLDRSRGAVQKPVTGKVGKAAMVEERKPKKAAVTTGYLGSARPPPSKAKPGSSRPGVPGAGLVRDRDREGSSRRPNPMGMFSKPRRQRDEDYDEDMDDFVVDDEEEEDDGYGYGSRYRYAEDEDESDMEAGYSDVEDEEAAAARLARLEDAREEALLEKRKREKEARKRAVLQRR